MAFTLKFHQFRTEIMFPTLSCLSFSSLSHCLRLLSKKSISLLWLTVTYQKYEKQFPPYICFVCFSSRQVLEPVPTTYVEILFSVKRKEKLDTKLG